MTTNCTSYYSSFLVFAELYITSTNLNRLVELDRLVCFYVLDEGQDECSSRHISNGARRVRFLSYNYENKIDKTILASTAAVEV